MQIAIDGPAASGKSTAAKILAKKLNFLYIDTGAMYRAVTYAGICGGISFDSDDVITAVARELVLDMRQDWSTDRGFRVYIGDAEVTELLFSPSVDSLVSTTARIADVRVIMVEKQRLLAGDRDVVMAGRDIGSCVLREADLKIFLTAAPEVRAIRRLKELEEKGIHKTFQEILDNIVHRDTIDSTRTDSPLVQAPDAVVVDCSYLTIDEMVEVLETTARERLSA